VKTLTKTELQQFEEGKKLPIIEEFYTLQGEGYHTGKAAYFIRIGGCDIACSWCDTKFSWNSQIHNLIDVNLTVENAKKTTAKAVVVTGGEPSNYNLNYLCEQLKKCNIETFIETSGVYKLTGIWDWICLSPKQHNQPQADVYQKAHELKVIINTDKSFEWAEECAKKVSPACKLFLQPEWSIHKIMTHKIVDYIKENPKWSLSIQTHKFIKIP